MIVDSLERLRQYAALYPGIEKAADFLESLAPDIPSGTYPLLGSRIYAVVQRYETQPEEYLKWECHERYLDLQYLQSGQETILYTRREHLENCTPYDEARDCVTSDRARSSVPLGLSAGQFVLLYPWDAHKPKCVFLRQSQVTKVVVKLALPPFSDNP